MFDIKRDMSHSITESRTLKKIYFTTERPRGNHS